MKGLFRGNHPGNSRAIECECLVGVRAFSELLHFTFSYKLILYLLHLQILQGAASPVTLSDSISPLSSIKESGVDRLFPAPREAGS